LLPWFLGGALVAASGLLALQVAAAPQVVPHWPLYDYSAFWAAGRLNALGQDPYDPVLLETYQRQADPNGDGVLVMWPAPWALTALAPFALLEPQASHFLWILFLFAVLVFAVDWGWREQGGDSDERWVAWLLAFTFLPTYLVLVAGQFGPLILLGFVGFGSAVRRGRDLEAGAWLVLAAIKPQLTFLFWIALILWVVQSRRWRVLAGAGLALTAALALPLLQNPLLPSYYWQALSQRTTTHSHNSPLLATAVRLLFAPEMFALQFVFVIPGFVWLAWYWRRHRYAWNWPEHLPALLFASFLTAPYGAWPFDLVVLLIPLLGSAVRLEHGPRRRQAWAALGHVTIGAVALAQLWAGAAYFSFLWLTPALFALRLVARPTASAQPSDTEKSAKSAGIPVAGFDCAVGAI
jgi:hypothetical protein